jgi:hypothetical protein
MLATLLLLAAAAGPAAAAGCTDRLAAVSARVPTVSDPTKRALLEYDVKHAQRELAEGDERDCNKALDHAEQLLGAQP